MIVRWRVYKYDDTVTRREYDRETAKYLWRGDRRYSKTNSYEKHFDTKAEAVAWLIARTESKVLHLRRNLERAEVVLSSLRKGEPA